MKMLKMSDLTEKLHLGRATIYRMISDGIFPPGYGDGRYRRWPESEIKAVANFQVLNTGVFKMKSNDYDHTSDLLKALIHITDLACDHPNRPVNQSMLGLLFEQMQGLVADMDISKDAELKQALEDLLKSEN